MKKSVLVWLATLAVLPAAPSAFADFNECLDKLAQKDLELAEAQRAFDAGELDIIQYNDVRLSVSDTQYECRRTTKRNYCRFQFSLLAFKAETLEQRVNEGSAKPEDLQAVQSLIEQKREFCRLP